MHVQPYLRQSNNATPHPAAATPKTVPIALPSACTKLRVLGSEVEELENEITATKAQTAITIQSTSLPVFMGISALRRMMKLPSVKRRIVQSNPKTPKPPAI